MDAELKRRKATKWQLFPGILRKLTDAVPTVVGRAPRATSGYPVPVKTEPPEADFRTFFETAAVGAAQVDVTTRRFVRVNHRFCTMAGYTADELCQMSFIDITAEDDCRQSIDLFERAVRGEIAEFSLDKRLRRKDGTIMWVSETVSMVRDEMEGVPLRTVCVVKDIEEQKRAERALRESEERFRSLAESCPDIVWVTNVGGQLEYVNRTYLEFFGITRDQASAFDWRSVVHPEDIEPFVDAFVAAMWRRQPFHARARVRRGDGQWRCIESRGNPRVDSAGHVTGYVGSSVDITDLYESREMLEQADRRKNEFLATLAHELRNPLAPILNSLHILRVTNALKPSSRSVHEVLERQIMYIARLVDDLLEVSRISSGKIELRKELVSLPTAINSAIETSGPLIESARHRVHLSFPAEPLLLDGDPIRLTQIFANLVNNAVKYTAPGGDIWVTAHRSGTEAVVSVRDNGVGIPPEMLSSVFEMFAQVDYSAERTHGGLGIGLTLVKSLTQLHGGTVEARSEGIGHGSEFIVRLPLVSAATVGEPSSARQVAGALPTARYRVLVVDDHQDAANSLRMLLELAGNEVLVANDGLTALDIAERFQPDVVFLDIGMPRMNGYEVARQLRANPKLRHMKMFALTGIGHADARRHSEEVGFDDYFVKPVRPEVLQALMSNG
jgi:PAS domain S-box-containing protein